MRHDPVRRSYDTVAETYAAEFGGELAGKPLDRALLGCVAEQTRQTVPSAPIADLGCGPGHVSGRLDRHGARVVGIDLSPGMVAAGRKEYPEVEFRQGDFLDLPARDAEFGAAVALYSIIHLQPGELTPAFAEMRRVLRPSGLVLVSFHIGAEVRHLDQWWGYEVDIDFRFLEPPGVAAAVERAGFRVTAQLDRVSYPAEVDTRRGYLLAQCRD